jgi:biopolymer transport protein ExbB/TolQ
VRRKTKLIVWLVAGIILALGPVWGNIGTVVGMILTFGNGGQPQPQAEALASSISLALCATAVGWIACPIGIVIIIVSGAKLVKAAKETGIPHEASLAIGTGVPQPER